MTKQSLAEIIQNNLNQTLKTTTYDSNFVHNWFDDNAQKLLDDCNYQTSKQTISAYDFGTNPAVIISNQTKNGPLTLVVELASLNSELDDELLDYLSDNTKLQLQRINYDYHILTNPKSTQDALTDAYDFVAKED